ncbi:hypothetical protein [Pseudomarimonas arenosa]|nr:hypothetical protein [Pseudomarimonas arenosa]
MTDINLPFRTVFKLAVQFAAAGAFIWFIVSLLKGLLGSFLPG